HIEMPLRNERLWQRVFYSLKKEVGDKFDVLADLRFDWDGPYPRSKEVAEYVQALHWTGNTSATNPSWEKMTLDDEVAREWLEELEGMDPDVQELTNVAFEKAKSTFSS